MAKTLSSSSSPYCSITQFLQRYDTRTLAQLLSDTGIDISDVTTDTTLLELLMEASGKLEAACFMGERYLKADLEAIRDGSATNAKSLLAGIVADLAIVCVFDRRPNLNRPRTAKIEESERFVMALAEGSRIFPFTETEVAGHLGSNVETPAIVENRNMWTYQARRFFGTRGNRIPRHV